MLYKVVAEIDPQGDPLFVGTEMDCDACIQAFVKYGIPERKFLVIPPEHVDFKLPDDLAEAVVKEVVQRYVDGRDYSGYIREQAEHEVADMHDYELMEEYEECIYWDDEEDQDLIRMKECFNSYLAEKILLERGE